MWYHNIFTSISLWCSTGLGFETTSLYTAEIGSIIAAYGLLHHCYADDTQIYVYCRPSDCAALKGKVISCIVAIADWMTINKLRLNPSKSEFLWCAALWRHHHINKESFTLADSEVQPVGIVRNLDAYFNSNMNMKRHINWLIQLLPIAKDTVNKVITTDSDGHHVDKQLCDQQGWLLRQPARWPPGLLD